MDKKYRVGWTDQFYYMCHIDNLGGILKGGIFSHNRIIQTGTTPITISNPEIIGMRGIKEDTINHKSLWDYANVYFRVKNAMHYRIMNRIGSDKIVILVVKKSILNLPDTIITDGNAASLETNFYQKDKIKLVLKQINPIFKYEWWGKVGSTKRQMMAECLVPDYIPPNYISKVIVLDRELKSKIESDFQKYLSKHKIHLISQANFFNKPIEQTSITDNISLLEGDMFFSDCQTLTVSVNTVGVMGKGLASTVKYIVPDVYVRYQDVLRNGKLSMGKPYLYKREESIKEVLGEEDYFDDEEPTWFLIFATKNHWRNPSDIAGIEEGLKHLRDNYKKWGIKSIALPALGCGLGWLSWEEVGPLMIKYLKDMDIPIEIYLPREINIPKDKKTKEFLLNGNN